MAPAASRVSPVVVSLRECERDRREICFEYFVNFARLRLSLRGSRVPNPYLDSPKRMSLLPTPSCKHIASLGCGGSVFAGPRLILSLSSRRSLGYVPCLFAAIQGLSKLGGAACTNVRGGALSLSDVQRRAVVSRQRRASYCGCAGASCCVSSLSLSL